MKGERSEAGYIIAIALIAIALIAERAASAEEATPASAGEKVLPFASRFRPRNKEFPGGPGGVRVRARMTSQRRAQICVRFGCDD